MNEKPKVPEKLNEYDHKTLKEWYGQGFRSYTTVCAIWNLVKGVIGYLLACFKRQECLIDCVGWLMERHDKKMWIICDCGVHRPPDREKCGCEDKPEYCCEVFKRNVMSIDYPKIMQGDCGWFMKYTYLSGWGISYCPFCGAKL